MKGKILTIMLLACMSTSIFGQTPTNSEPDYDILYDKMFTYIYLKMFNSSDDSDDLDTTQKNEGNDFKEYLKVENLLTATTLKTGAKIPYNCILGFTPTTIHPSKTYMVLKSGNDCEIICSEFQTLDYSYILHRQLSQAYEFFQKHQPQLDVELFPQYAKIICDVFIKNSRYLE